MKIVHLTVAREIPYGIIRQLLYEHISAKKLDGIEWTTIAVHDKEVVFPFMKRVPIMFRGIFVRNIYAWILALYLSRKYDIVMMRHIPFDFTAFLFAPFIKNRVSVHHSKEIDELKLVRKGWKGKAASFFERFSGRFVVRRSKVILGVTQEIAEYERRIHGSNQPIGCYPNGIDTDLVQLLKDERQPDEINVAFMCTKFTPWQGLDKLVDAVDIHVHKTNEFHLIIHLIGSLFEEQIVQLESSPTRKNCFRYYGVLDEKKYRKILQRCDFGIGSFALERENLKEGSTLKVREMLAMGLPVYSGHNDIALPPSEKFVKIEEEIRYEDLLAFGKVMKNFPREQIRAASIPRICKRTIMEKCAELMVIS